MDEKYNNLLKLIARVKGAIEHYEETTHHDFDIVDLKLMDKALEYATLEWWQKE